MKIWDKEKQEWVDHPIRLELMRNFRVLTPEELEERQDEF